MSIIWKYLDKRSAAVNAIKDFSSMKFIIDHTDEEIKSTYEKMGGVNSVRGKVILQSQGKEFFTWHGKDFFT